MYILQKLNLLEKLNSNLDILLDNPKREQIEQLLERLAIIDECIDQTLLIILLEELEGRFPRAVNRLRN